MTALEIVQAAYPGIPVAILNQFAGLLPAEAAAIDSEFANTESKFFPVYKANVTNLRRPVATFRYMHPDMRIPAAVAYYNSNFNMSQAFTLLNPQNTSDRQATNLNVPFWASDTIEMVQGGQPIERGDSATRYATLTVIYDRRLFKNVGYTPNIRKGFTLVPGQAPIYLNRVYWAQTIQPTPVTFTSAPYFGIDAVKVMYENGITIADINYDDVYTFSTYLNAYKKFATQIDSEKNLLEQQARNTVNNYKQQLDDQAAREYADLQAKKIQLLIAIDNDAKSAQRDFQNMLLTAQGLKNQIGSNLG